MKKYDRHERQHKPLVKKKKDIDKPFSVYTRFLGTPKDDIFSFLFEWRLSKKFSSREEANKWIEKEQRTFSGLRVKREYKIDERQD